MNPLSSPVHKFTSMAAFAAIVLLVSIGILMLLTVGCSSTHSEEGQIMRVAHRGGAALAPENTLIAFTTGLEHDADALEMDIHLSKDGIIVVAHDPTLARTTNQLGMISDYDAITLSSFNAAINFSGEGNFGEQPISTLEEVLTHIESKALRPVFLQIEIKVKSDGSRYEGIEEKLIKILQERKLIDSTIIISFDFPSLQKIHELEPRLKTGALISTKYMSAVGVGGPKSVANEMASLGVDYVGINHQFLSQTLYNEFRSHNLGVGVWTVNDENSMKRFATLGVDFITSDRPDLLKKILEPTS
jgi:glycerophosphoryl diester phosphodiesterase